jgi:hypothetical protein
MKTIDSSHVVKLQSFWRGYRDRIVVALLKKSSRVKKKYFLEEEFWETISHTIGFTLKQAI